MIGINETLLGEGKEVRDGDKVTMHYRGRFPGGKEFDNSYDRGQPFSFKVGSGQVIKGFDLGVIGMKEGGKRTVSIPSEFGYGSRGAGGAIPPNADLEFDLEIISVN